MILYFWLISHTHLAVFGSCDMEMIWISSDSIFKEVCDGCVPILFGNVFDGKMTWASSDSIFSACDKGCGPIVVWQWF